MPLCGWFDALTRVVAQMAIGLCSRSDDIVEPVIRPQWWVRCKEIAQRSVKVSRRRGVRSRCPD